MRGMSMQDYLVDTWRNIRSFFYQIFYRYRLMRKIGRVYPFDYSGVYYVLEAQLELMLESCEKTQIDGKYIYTKQEHVIRDLKIALEYAHRLTGKVSSERWDKREWELLRLLYPSNNCFTRKVTGGYMRDYRDNMTARQRKYIKQQYQFERDKVNKIEDGYREELFKLLTKKLNTWWW